MGRSTTYNRITTSEKISKINPSNNTLKAEFLGYLRAVNRSNGTIYQYSKDLDIFFCWNLDVNNNKDFTKISKREFVMFQHHSVTEWHWSPNRIRRVKSAISSMSNFIENILDEEEGYENYHSIIRKIESPVIELVREKTVFKMCKGV